MLPGTVFVDWPVVARRVPIGWFGSDTLRLSRRRDAELSAAPRRETVVLDGRGARLRIALLEGAQAAEEELATVSYEEGNCGIVMSKAQIAELNGELMKRGKLLALLETRIRALLLRIDKSANAVNFCEERGKLAGLADKIVALSRFNALARAATVALDDWEEAVTQVRRESEARLAVQCHGHEGENAACPQVQRVRQVV